MWKSGKHPLFQGNTTPESPPRGGRALARLPACCLSLLLLLSLAACAQVPKQAEQGSAVRSVAVWDIEDLSPSPPSQSGLGELLSGRIIEVIGGKNDYTVVERQRLLLALEELNLGSASLADEATRLKLGRMIGAQLMVFGSTQVVADQMRLDLRLVDVETGRIIRAAERTVPGSDLGGWLAAAGEAAEELM